MVGRDGLKLLLLWMVERFCERSAERRLRTAGDAESFEVGEEVGDDVAGVGGVEEAGGGEVSCQETQQGGERFGKGSAGFEGVDGGEFHQERREPQGVATPPDFERQDFVDEAAITDLTDLLGYVGFEPGIEPRLP